MYVSKIALVDTDAKHHQFPPPRGFPNGHLIWVEKQNHRVVCGPPVSVVVRILAPVFRSLHRQSRLTKALMKLCIQTFNYVFSGDTNKLLFLAWVTSTFLVCLCGYVIWLLWSFVICLLSSTINDISVFFNWLVVPRIAGSLHTHPICWVIICSGTMLYISVIYYHRPWSSNNYFPVYVSVCFLQMFRLFYYVP